MIINGYTRVHVTQKEIEMEEEKGASMRIDLGDIGGATVAGAATGNGSGSGTNQSFTGSRHDTSQIHDTQYRSHRPSITLTPSNLNSNHHLAESSAASALNTPITRATSSDFDLWIDPKSASKLKQGRAFRRLFSELMNSTERRLLYFVLFSIFCCGALRLIFFIFIAGIIDLLADTYYSDLHHICNLHEYIHCDTNNQLIHVFAVTLIVVSIFAAIFGFARSTLTSIAVCSFMVRLNEVLFDKLMDQNLSFFESRRKHDLRNLLTNDMKTIRLSLHRIVIVIEALIHFLCGSMYLFIINWDIACIIVGSFVLLSIISIVFIQKSDAVHKLRRQAFKLVTTGVIETLSYITTIKTFSKEDDESYIYEQCIHRAFASAAEANSLLYAYRFWMSIIIYFTILSIIWYVAFLMFDYHSSITLGVLVIDLFIFLQLNWSIYQIVIFAPVVTIKASQSLIRMFQIIDIPNTHGLHKQKSKCNYIPRDCEIEGRIQMRNVHFAYPNRKRKLILNDISMDFYPSTTTALVGVSGCGKSTILNLLMRFYDAGSGEILIDGIDYTKYNVAFLHSQIGYVGHNVHLFENRSIGDNIKFGMKLDKKHQLLFDAKYFDEENMYFWRQLKSINQAEVERVAKIANAHDFIMDLEEGYDTKIGGDHGIQLSHGERQRIGIARALLLNPRILLLDEAMSGVDAVSKGLIQESLDRIMIGRCVIVIAHRLKTVQNADRIYVIKNGKNVGYGQHQELVDNNNEHYLELTHKRSVFC